MSNSIGLIESKGLVALIEATDVILKNSPVKILGIKKLENGLVSLAVFGNSEYVNVAIESAVDAGRRVGEIYASTVVDDPGKELMVFINNLFPSNNTIEASTKTTKTEYGVQAVPEINKEALPLALISNKDKTESKREKSKPLSVTKLKPNQNIKKVKNKPTSESHPRLDNIIPENSKEIQKVVKPNDEFSNTENSMSTIERLRMEALGLENKKIKTKADGLPDKKNEEESIHGVNSKEIGDIDFDAIKKMNVHKLRHYAREFPEFPIKGREISRANRGELVELFESISKNSR